MSSDSSMSSRVFERTLNLKWCTRKPYLLLDKLLRLHDGCTRRYCTLCFSVTDIESIYSYPELSDDHRMLGIFHICVLYIYIDMHTDTYIHTHTQHIKTTHTYKRVHIACIYTRFYIQSCYYFRRKFNAGYPIVSNIGFSDVTEIAFSDRV